MKSNKKIMWLIVCAISAIFCSCIGEGNSNCYVEIRFDYSRNLSSENRFAEQADIVTLYLFDEAGVLRYKDSVNIGSSDDWSMWISRPVRGSYRFAAFARSTGVVGDAANFEVPELAVGTSVIEDLTLRLRTDAGVQQHELNNHFIGTTTRIGYEGQSLITVPVSKVNKKFVINLHPEPETSPLDASEFDIRITDGAGNGLVNYNFELLNDIPVIYRPYRQENINDDGGLTFVNSELNTSRIVTDHDPRLTVTDMVEGIEIFDISLISILAALRQQSGATQWDLQEYIDRLEECVIDIYMDSTGWIAVRLTVNGWVVNLDDIDL